MALNMKKLIGRAQNIADDFDRTIISFESPYQLKDLCPPPGSETEVNEERMREQFFKLRFAQHDEAFNNASMLVQKRYAWRGFPKAQLKKYPNRITILSFHQEKIVGTVTVGYDSDEGMMGDEIYKPEIDALRAKGRRVGELSKLAIDENIGSKQLLASLVHRIAGSWPADRGRKPLQQRAPPALPFEIVQAAGGHQSQHDRRECQRLGQQRGQLVRNRAGFDETRADAGIDGAAQYQRLDQHQDQQVKGHVMPKESDHRRCLK